MSSVRSRFSSAVAVVATGCLLVALSACSEDQQPEHVGAAGGTATPPKPTDPSSYKSFTEEQSSGAGAAVQRRTLTKKLDVDVRVKVELSGGEVKPMLGDVKVQSGDEVEVDVTSDEDQEITVGGYPDATADVEAGETEDVEFTVAQQGNIEVKAKPAGVTLVTFVAGD